MMQKIKNFLFTNTGTKQTIVKNTFWLFSGEIIGRLFRMFLILYAARILGKDGWGVFSYALSFVGIAMTFSDLGLGTLVTKKASEENPSKKYISTIFYFKLALLILNTVLVIILLPQAASIAESKPIIPIVALVLFFDSLREFFIAINRATEKMEKEGFIKILTNTLIVVLGFYFLITNPTVSNFALSYLIGSAIGTIFLVILIRKILKNVWKNFSLSEIKNIWSSAWPIGILGLFMIVIGNVDIFMLGIWTNAGDIGLYAASQRLIVFFHMIPVLISSAILPRMTKLLTEDVRKIKNILETVIAGTTIISIPVVLGSIFFGKEILGFLLGESYTAAAAAFSILATSLIFVLPNILLMTTIIVFEKQKKFILPVASGMIINIILNIIFIPKFGIVGAAVTTLASQIYIYTFNYIKFQKVQRLNISRFLPKIFLANLIIFFVIMLIKNINVHILISISIVILSYLVTLLALKEPICKKIIKI